MPETTPKPIKPPKKTAFITTDAAFTQVAAEEAAKKLGKPPEKVTVEEAAGELRKLAEITQKSQ